jgi:hypothetical protein
VADFAAVADKFVADYNAKDFDAMSAVIAPDIDFTHFNRDFILQTRDDLIGVLRQFAQDCAPDRHFEAPERVMVLGNTVIREAWYVGTAKIDLPGFGMAGESFRLKFCSVMRFSDEGILVQWYDYG